MNQVLPTATRLHPLVAAAAVSVIAVSAAGVGVLTGVLPTGHANSAATIAAPAVASLPAPAAAQVVAAAPASVAPAAEVTPAPVPVPKVAHVAKPRPVKVAAVSAPREPAYPAPASNAGTQRQGPNEPYTYGTPGTPPPAGGYGSFGSAPPPPIAQAPAPKPVCANCGVIEAVVESQKAGAASGLGMAGGALGGAVVGKQFGKGHGQDALAILGAIGGAIAGHQVEKSVRSTKVYEIRVRMEDGSTRSVTQSTPPAWRNGDRVRLDGDSISLNS